MTGTRDDIFRTGLQVSPERIARLQEGELGTLMLALLRAQAARCGADASQITVNTQEKAADGGADGWSPAPARADPWLGSTETCWQFKAGTAGEPAKIAGEVDNAIPRRVLAAGGRFALVASGSTSGLKGVDDRRASLVAKAVELGLPADAIEVIGSERLTTWCNQHPAIAARFAGRPSGLWTLDDWASSDQHQVAWQSTPELDEALKTGRHDLSFGESVLHFHVQGPPGVGKTRLALELCKGASWNDAVLYVRQAGDLRLMELIDGAASESDVRLVVVADEVRREQLEPLRSAVSRGGGRIRLITVGHCETPDPVRIPALKVAPLDLQRMLHVVQGWYAALPREHVAFVARFADGYVRLARLAADAVMRNQRIDTRGLLDQAHIRTFLDGMLGERDRSPLYVVAALTHVGWTDERQSEGEAIAAHFGLNWNTVRAEVERFHDRFGIVPRGGRTRYISPHPLAVHLAAEAWRTWPDLLKTLPQALPNDASREAYYKRLETIASSAQAKEFSRGELESFASFSDYLDVRAAMRWAVLAAADPVLAAQRISDALVATSEEKRRSLGDQARRQVVRTLVKIAMARSSFRNAVRSLALLAEAENESWANNATAEFVARFSPVLGGTSTPYRERLELIDELITLGRSGLDRLAIRALGKAADQFATRLNVSPLGDAPPEPEWNALRPEQHTECLLAAIERLRTLARKANGDLAKDLVPVVERLLAHWRNEQARSEIAKLIQEVAEALPDTRETLRRIIARFVTQERKYSEPLPEEAVCQLRDLEVSLRGASLEARLKQHVGVSFWNEPENPEMPGLAEEFLKYATPSSPEWQWLLSGDAGAGWRFGQLLAEKDDANQLATSLPAINEATADFRVLSSYLLKKSTMLGNQWLERWLEHEYASERLPIALLADVVKTRTASEAVIRLFLRAITERGLNASIAEQLSFGPWWESIGPELLGELVEQLVALGHSAAAIAVIEQRLESKPAEHAYWAPIALQLVTRSELIRSSNMVKHFWMQVAMRIVDEYPVDVAQALLREHSDRSTDVWFLEHDEGTTVLARCIQLAPGAVWDCLSTHLSDPLKAQLFAIGFPGALLNGIAPSDIDKWVAENGAERAAIVARLVPKDVSSDGTLAARLLDTYPQDKELADTMFSHFVSGSWIGPAADHWEELASMMENVSGRTTLPGLREWAQWATRELREMARRDRIRDEERRLQHS